LNAWGTFNGSSERIKALAELTLSSGLRIGDAATISETSSSRTATAGNWNFGQPRPESLCSSRYKNNLSKQFNGCLASMCSGRARARQQIAHPFGKKGIGDYSSTPVSLAIRTDFVTHLGRIYA
jgi:hypothetical protein